MCETTHFQTLAARRGVHDEARRMESSRSISATAAARPPLPFGFAHSRDKRRTRPSGWQKTLRRRLNATFARECQSVHSVVLARTTDGVRIVVECSDCSSVSVPDCIKGLRVSLSVASVLRTECVRSFPTLIRYLRSKNQVSYGPQPFGYPS